MFKFCCEDCGECWYVGNPRTCKCPDEELQQPKQEQVKPVAWEQFHEHMAGPNYVAPQRTWVGLTDEEIAEVEDEYIVDYRIPAGSAWNFAKDIESKLKGKNHGNS